MSGTSDLCQGKPHFPWMPQYPNTHINTKSYIKNTDNNFASKCVYFVYEKLASKKNQPGVYGRCLRGPSEYAFNSAGQPKRKYQNKTKNIFHAAIASF